MEITHLQKADSLQTPKSKTEDTAAPAKTPFIELFSQQQEALSNATWEKMIGEIDAQGKKLLKNQSLENLRQYKKLVKQLLTHTVKNGISLEERKGLNARGRQKNYKMIAEVDKKLLELTDNVLKQEEKGLSVLGIIDEIRGLLINLTI